MALASIALSPTYSKVEASDTTASLKIDLTRRGYCPDHPDVKTRVRSLTKKTEHNECYRCKEIHQINIEKLQNENNNDQAKLDQLINELEKEKKRREDAEEELFDTECKLKEAENRIDDLEERNSDLLESKSELERKLSTSSVKLEEVATEFIVIKQKISDTKIIEQKYDYIFQVILLGNTSVGKSAIVKRFQDGIYIDELAPTIGIDFASKKFEIKKNSKNVKVCLRVWDSAGQEQFKSINRQYFRDKEAVIFLYDVSDKSTFDEVPVWLKDFKQNTNIKFDPVMYLIGSKSDLDHDVNYDDASKWAHDNSMSFREYSAKNDINGTTADTIMKDIVNNILDSSDIMKVVDNSSKSKNKKVVDLEQKSSGSKGGGGGGGWWGGFKGIFGCYSDSTAKQKESSFDKDP